MENLEPTEKSKISPSEEEIREDIRESLKLSPFFGKMTSAEQEQFINETYERYQKDKKKQKEEK